MKKAIFFTSVFPFKTVGENFFESELEGVAREFDKVYVVACEMREQNPEVKKTLPENVTAISLQTESVKKSVIKGIFKLPFRALFWKEFAKILKGGHPFVQSFRSLVYAGSMYISICKRFPFLKKQIELSKDDEVVFFGYWLTFVSRAILSFRKYLGRTESPAMSRAHGSADVMNIAEPKRFYPFQKYLLDKLDAVFAVSEGGREHLAALANNPDKVKSIYIGVQGPSAKVQRSREPFVVMSCSNIIPLKRVRKVGSAVRRLIGRIPDIQWVHFGDGNLRNEVEKEFADIESHVTFFGYTPHDEVLKYLESGRASVFVSASATEGLPVSIIEAAAYGLPSIATDVGSTREIAISGISGTLIDSDIVGSTLADEIYKYYQMTDAEYDEISSKAYELYSQSFDCTKNGQKFAKAILNVKK